MLKKNENSTRIKKSRTVKNTKQTLSGGSDTVKERSQPGDEGKDVINNYYNNSLQKKSYNDEKLGIFSKFILEYKTLFIILCFFGFVFLGFFIALIILAVKYRICSENEDDDYPYCGSCPTCICPVAYQPSGEGGSIILTINKTKDDSSTEILSHNFIFANSYQPKKINDTDVEDGWDGFYKELNNHNDGEYNGNLTMYFPKIATTGDKMFYNIEIIEEIDFEGFNFNYITSMEKMFYGMIKLKTIKNFNFDTSKIQSMQQMFYQCKELNFTEMKFTKINIDNITSTSEMFYGCKNLETMTIESSNKSNLIDMNRMFAQSSIKEFKMTNIKAEILISLSEMFKDCEELNSVDFSGLETPNLRNVDGIFSGFDKTKPEVHVSGWYKSEMKIDRETFENEICGEISTIDSASASESMSNTPSDSASESASYSAIDSSSENKPVKLGRCVFE